VPGKAVKKKKQTHISTLRNNVFEEKEEKENILREQSFTCTAMQASFAVLTINTTPNLSRNLSSHTCGHLGNVGGLLLNRDEHVAGLVVEALARVIEADHLDSVTHNLLVVEVRLGGDLSEDHDHAGLAGSLASDLGVGILGQARIQHRVGDNVAELVCDQTIIREVRR
jgi:hypothetical protein